MEKLTNLELVGVVYENDNKKAVLTFLDEDRGEIREVNFNKQVYDNGKYVDDPEKAEKVDEWCQEYFGLTFDQLSDAIGTRKDVYAYDNFNSLWEAEIVSKFDKDMVGQIVEGTITEITVDDIAIKVKFDYDGDIYQGKFTYAEYLETRKEWFTNPQKKKKQFERFESKFHVPVEDKDELVGKHIMVEVKTAFGKVTYADIKPLPKPKA